MANCVMSLIHLKPLRKLDLWPNLRSILRTVHRKVGTYIILLSEGEVKILTCLNFRFAFAINTEQHEFTFGLIPALHYQIATENHFVLVTTDIPVDKKFLNQFTFVISNAFLDFFRTVIFNLERTYMVSGNAVVL